MAAVDAKPSKETTKAKRDSHLLLLEAIDDARGPYGDSRPDTGGKNLTVKRRKYAANVLKGDSTPNESSDEAAEGASEESESDDYSDKFPFVPSATKQLKEMKETGVTKKLLCDYIVQTIGNHNIFCAGQNSNYENLVRHKKAFNHWTNDDRVDVMRKHHAPLLLKIEMKAAKRAKKAAKLLKSEQDAKLARKAKQQDANLAAKHADKKRKRH